MKRLLSVTMLITTLTIGGIAIEAKTPKKSAKSYTTKTQTKNKQLQSFSTPDLTLFEVHGPVKSISNYSPLGLYYIFDSNDSNTYYFNQKGECRKRQQDEYFKGFKYDKNGRITGGKFAESGGYPVLELTWDNLGRLIKIFDSYGMHNITETYTYNSNGDLIKTSIEEISHGLESKTIHNYKILERDVKGNWIKREVSTTEKTTDHNQETEPSTSESYVNTETRHIEYF